MQHSCNHLKHKMHLIKSFSSFVFLYSPLQPMDSFSISLKCSSSFVFSLVVDSIFFFLLPLLSFLDICWWRKNSFQIGSNFSHCWSNIRDRRNLVKSYSRVFWAFILVFRGFWFMDILFELNSWAAWLRIKNMNNLFYYFVFIILMNEICWLLK